MSVGKKMFCHLDFVALVVAVLVPGELAEGSIHGYDELVGGPFNGNDQGNFLIQLERKQLHQ